MEKVFINEVSREFKVHNKREKMVIQLIRTTISNIIALQDINYMKNNYPDWTLSDNERAIENQTKELNGILLSCFYLDMIDGPKYVSAYEVVNKSLEN